VSDLHELTALETAATIRRGDVRVLDVVEHALDRAETLGARLGAFAVVTPDLARDAARALDAAIGGGEVAGPLAGVPTAIKDLTATAGVPTGRGSVVTRGWLPEFDDDLVGLLRAAGTVSIGKTAVPEFGLPCYTEPEGAPPAVTPWDVTRSAGGSSGGAAAAVAAGVLPVAQGSDGGGSIRIPASVCGLVGIKTTRGRVPAGPAGGDPAGLSVAGPLARTVADAAAFLDALCGGRSWPGEPFVPAAPPPDGGYLGVAQAAPGPRRRIGLATSPPFGDLTGVLGPEALPAVVDPVCVAAAEETAAVLESLGHVVEPVDVHLSDEAITAFVTLWAVLALADPVDPADEERLRPVTRLLRARGREVGSMAALGALHVAQVETRRIVASRASLDAVLTPSVALPPRPVGWFSADGPETDFARQVAFTPWTAIANMTGEPAIGLPTGWPEVEGTTLPVGVTLRGRRGEEDVLVALGAEIEAARPWAGRRPPVW
jgi:amidase